jgi:hypothetical protein
MACGKNGSAETSDNAQARASEPGVIATGTVPRDTTGDPDVATQGNGLPTGYQALFDKSSATTSDASYRAAGTGRWEVTTGAAHVLFNPADTASGTYTLSATFEQIEKPAHPEAYGVFWGGSSLDNRAKQRYTYFLVRGDGKYMVKVREGARTRTITDWTAHTGLPHEDASGKALFGVKVDVDDTGAKVSVNGVPITTIPASGNPMDGQAGVRINHNLHLYVTPASLVRG